VLSNDRLRPVFQTARGVFPGRPFFGFVDVFSGEKKAEDDWRELAALGLERVYVGIETGHDPLLRWIDKPSSSREAAAFVSTLKSAGLGVSAIVMVGVGGDRFADGHVRDTVRLVERLPLDAGDLIYLSPFVEHGRLEYGRIDRQYETLRDAFRSAHPAVQVARYDIREFVY
jgi:radical SAM superfamily enzyme YgiQ (UPF0313 family)